MRVQQESSGPEIQLVTFSLGSEQYAVEVLKVKEIILPIDTFPVPGMPEHVKGVINLRGEIVPILEIHTLLGVPEREVEDKDRKHRIIILDTADGGIGFEVDGVTEVIRIKADSVKPSPDVGNPNFNKEILLGIVQTPKGIIICIDPVKLIKSTIGMEELAGCRG